MNGLNNTDYLNDKQTEVSKQKEVQKISEAQNAKEFNVIPNNSNEIAAQKQQQTTAQTVKTKQSFVTGLATSVVAAVAAVVVGVVSLLNVGLNAKFSSETTYRDGWIYYVVQVENWDEESRLRICINEDEYFELWDEDGDGLIEGEIPLDVEAIQHQMEGKDNVRVQYRLDLKADVGLDLERTYDSYVVQLDKFTSSIQDVDMWCTCQEDGYYNFQIHYDDPLGKFSGFEAYIEDGNGNIAYCEFTENPHDAQHIFVNQLEGSRCRLFIRYFENGEETFIRFDNEQEDGTVTNDNYKEITL